MSSKNVLAYFEDVARVWRGSFRGLARGHDKCFSEGVANAILSADWLELREDPLAAIVRAAQSGDRVATRRVLEEVGPSVFAVVGAVLGRAHPDVDDVAQDAFVAIAGSLSSFRFESSVLHFARRIALRRATVALRRARALRRASSMTVALGEDVANDGASPFEAVIASRQMRLLRMLVVDLPDEQAETLLLKIVLGHSVEEIAETTQTPLNTVKSRLRAARAAIRERIAADPGLGEMLEEDSR